MTTIKSRIIRTELRPWRELRLFQPQKIKRTTPERLGKLAHSLAANGFIDHFKVWEHDGGILIIDGSHRWQALDHLAESGAEVPDMAPCDFMNIRDEREAKKLVALFNSRYADLMKDETLEWFEDLDLDELLEEADLPIDLIDDEAEVKINEREYDEHVVTSHQCPNCGYKWN